MTLLVAESAERLVGYLQIKASQPPPVRHRDRHPSNWRGSICAWTPSARGSGAHFMRAVFDEARRRGCQTLWLVVYSGNGKAREFYRRWGFADVGLKDFQFGGKVYSDPVMAAPVPAG